MRPPEPHPAPNGGLLTPIDPRMPLEGTRIAVQGVPVAAEPTLPPTPASTEAARQIHARVVALASRLHRAESELGCYLWYVREYQVYEALGHESFTEYLTSPDVGISRGHAYKLIAVAEAFYPGLLRTSAQGPDLVDDDARFAVPQAVQTLGTTKAGIIAGVVKAHPEQREEWVDRARTLTPQDLAIAVREAQDPQMSQEHEIAMELAGKVLGIGYHLRGSHQDVLPIIDELLEVVQAARAYLLQVRGGVAVQE